jgi:hypothetical protein
MNVGSRLLRQLYLHTAEEAKGAITATGTRVVMFETTFLAA